MTKRIVVRVCITLAVLLLATFSTARAHQVWSERQAQAKVLVARLAAHSELTSAKRVGVLQSELAPYRHRFQVIDAQSTPGGSPLWNTATLSFYEHQTGAYRALVRSITAEIRTSGVHERQAASVQETILGSTIAGATKLDLDVSPSRSALEKEGRIVGASTATPGELHRATATLSAANASLESQTKARTEIVQQAVSAVHGSLPTLLSTADTAAASAHNELALLGIVSPSDAKLGLIVDAALARVHAQKDVFSAAVKLTPLQDAVRAVNMHYGKDLPSKMIVVSTEDQNVQMYENGRQIYSSVVTTGGPELPTDHGVFHIYDKISPFTFHSPWPEGSPYYYPPSPVSYWMPFDGAQGLHDAPWRTNWGPGSNLSPTDLGGHFILGTHGCVNLPPATAQFMWDWAPIGTTVVVV